MGYEYPYSDEKGNYCYRYVGGKRIKIYEKLGLAESMKLSGKFTKSENSDESKNIRKTSDITIEELNKIVEYAKEYDGDIEKAVLDLYGCNNKYPTVLDEEEFNKSDGLQLYRGDGASTIENKKLYQDQFLNGDIYVRNNNCGTGVWFSDSIHTAESYKEGGGGTTTRNTKYSYITFTKIKKDAKIVLVDELPSKKDRLIMYGLENDTTKLSKIVYDDGLYATILGYDGIKMNSWLGHCTNYAITNRAILEVKKYD